MLTVNEPEPFTVKSSLEKITESILLSSMATNSPLFISVFSVESASVINTLSACLIYIAAEEDELIFTPFKTSWILSSSCASTII